MTSLKQKNILSYYDDGGNPVYLSVEEWTAQEYKKQLVQEESIGLDKDVFDPNTILRHVHTAWGEMRLLQEILQNTVDALTSKSDALIRSVELAPNTETPLLPSNINDSVISEARKRMATNLIKNANHMEETIVENQKDLMNRIIPLVLRGWRVMCPDDGSGRWVVDASANQLFQALLPNQFPLPIPIKTDNTEPLHILTIDGSKLRLQGEGLLDENLVSSISLCIWRGLVRISDRLSKLTEIRRTGLYELAIKSDNQWVQICLSTSIADANVRNGNDDKRPRRLMRHCLMDNFLFLPLQDRELLRIVANF